MLKFLSKSGIYIFLSIITIYLGISYIYLNLENKKLAESISKLEIINIFNNNLLNVEKKSWTLEKLLTENIDQLTFQVNDSTTIIPMTEFMKNQSPSINFVIHENSCHSCIDIELKRILKLTQNSNIEFNIFYYSHDWRPIKFLQRDYEIQFNVYKLGSMGNLINEDIFINPFYFITVQNKGEFIFIPLKENTKRSEDYFNYVLTIINQV